LKAADRTLEAGWHAKCTPRYRLYLLKDEPVLLWDGLMRCDICGGEIPWHQETVDTKSETGGFWKARIDTVQITLCPACAERRRKVRQLWIWSIGGIILVGLALAILAQFLR
jgi:hypothetical protein